MSQNYKEWINKVKKWDGLTWVVLPLLYLEKFVKIVLSELLDAYTKWDHQRFNNSLPKE
jgi:hypothetical protein|tara:strand:- start:2881 stop:3057 length:177 start_codon:yes stop_codon:yes gene_type:complete